MGKSTPTCSSWFVVFNDILAKTRLMFWVVFVGGDV